MASSLEAHAGDAAWQDATYNRDLEGALRVAMAYLSSPLSILPAGAYSLRDISVLAVPQRTIPSPQLVANNPEVLGSLAPLAWPIL